VGKPRRIDRLKKAGIDELIEAVTGTAYDVGAEIAVFGRQQIELLALIRHEADIEADAAFLLEAIAKLLCDKSVISPDVELIRCGPRAADECRHCKCASPHGCSALQELSSWKGL